MCLVLFDTSAAPVPSVARSYARARREKKVKYGEVTDAVFGCV